MTSLTVTSTPNATNTTTAVDIMDSNDLMTLSDDDDVTMDERNMYFEELKRNTDTMVSYWKTLPENYQNDKEFVLYVLQNCNKLPPKHELERKLPPELRFDRDYILAFLRRPDFHQLYYDTRGSLYVPDIYKNDPEIMLHYCTKIYRSLQDCSYELSNNVDIVMAAIQLSGLELQYASEEIRDTLDIVKLACQNHPCALEYCSIRVRTILSNDVSFMKSIILLPGGGTVLQKYAPPIIQKDLSFLLHAIQYHHMELQYMPRHLQESIEFLLQAIRIQSSIYLQITRQAIQKLYPIACEAVISSTTTPEIIELAFRMCPDMIRSRDVTLAICRQGDKSFVREYLVQSKDYNSATSSTLSATVSSSSWTGHNCIITRSNTSNIITSTERCIDYFADKEVMHWAVQKNCSIYWLCHASIKYDPFIIMATLTPPSKRGRNSTTDDDTTEQYEILHHLPSTLLLQHPEILIKAIEVCDADTNSNSHSPNGLKLLRPLIADELWLNDRDIAVAWIRKSANIPYPLQLRNVIRTRTEKGDCEIGYLVAKYCWYEFVNVSEKLRSDYNFMIHSVNECGLVLRFATIPAVGNGNPSNCSAMTMSLFVHAIANHSKALDPCYKERDHYQRHHLDRYLLLGGRGRAGFGDDDDDDDIDVVPMVHIPIASSVFMKSINQEHIMEYVKEKLALHETFVLQFLRGCRSKPISIANSSCDAADDMTVTSSTTTCSSYDTNDKHCILSMMLDCGVETDEALKKLIAEYAGVPIGKELTVLRRAHKNLVAQAAAALTVDKKPKIKIEILATSSGDDPIATRRALIIHRRMHMRHR